MSYRQIRDLSDAARHGVEVVVECQQCHHVRTLDAWPLSQLFRRRRWSGAIRDVGRRLRCTRCWPSVTIRLRLREDRRPPAE